MNRKSFLGMVIILLSLSTVKAQFTLQDAYPNLSFTNPVFLTHAGDGTDRVFVVEQAGIIKVFANTQSTSDAKIFLNITDRVSSGGEMGLLG